ncbi:CBP-like protein, partial [Mya arenaria]
PRELRTSVYHEILSGYLEFAKSQGFVWAHIWACPPGKGVDYIFHCHPPDQKIPKIERLLEFYKKWLEKAHIEGIVIDFKEEAEAAAAKVCEDSSVAKSSGKCESKKKKKKKSYCKKLDKPLGGNALTEKLYSTLTKERE